MAEDTPVQIMAKDLAAQAVGMIASKKGGRESIHGEAVEFLPSDEVPFL